MIMSKTRSSNIHASNANAKAYLHPKGNDKYNLVSSNDDLKPDTIRFNHKKKTSEGKQDQVYMDIEEQRGDSISQPYDNSSSTYNMINN